MLGASAMGHFMANYLPCAPLTGKLHLRMAQQAGRHSAEAAIMQNPRQALAVPPVVEDVQKSRLSRVTLDKKHRIPELRWTK